MHWIAAALIGLGCLAAALAGCGRAREALLRRAVLDRPNARSSHAAPVPRGGGLAVVPVVLLAWTACVVAGPLPLAWLVVALAAAGLGGLSFLDDLRGLPAGLRLAAQAAAVAAGLAVLPADALLFQGLLPVWADRLAAGLAWLWFVNLYNFMDGIDGITGVESVAVGLGLLLVLASDATLAPVAPLAAAIVGAALGFLWWNRPPARLFLGDVGSIGLGYLLGFLLLAVALAGHWQAALILPLYYLADATVTLVRRGLRGERVWQAHRTHFYQRAVAGLGGHAGVVRVVGCVNLLLVAAAWYAAVCPGREWRALLFAAAGTAAVLWYFERVGRQAAGQNDAA